MLQKLLADRFHLTVRQEQKTVKVYAITGRQGRKLEQRERAMPVLVIDRVDRVASAS